MNQEEIVKSKAHHYELEQRIEKIGKEQFPSVIRLSEALKELIEGIETIQEKEKTLHDPHVNVRIKMMKKGIKLGKNIKYFEDNIVLEFDQGNIPEETGKKFVAITKLIRKNKMWAAKQQFEYFQGLIDLSREYAKSSEALENEEKLLLKEQHNTQKLMQDFLWLEKQSVDEDKVRKYEQWGQIIKKLETLRRTYITSLSSKASRELLGDAYLSGDQFSEDGGKIKEIQAFFAEYPELGKYTAAQICALFGASEKKLSHVCAETSKFRASIAENKQIFEKLHALDRTSFLSITSGDAPTMEFYSNNIPGAAEAVEQLKTLSSQNQENEAEYQKHKEIEKKKQELSGYSKEQLEAQLQEINSSIKLLHSNPETAAPSEKREKRHLILLKSHIIL